jgi:hypothetical protein
MASIVVNGDTSGSVTLSAPAVAGTVTVTLPATTGTMLTTASSTGISGSAISSGTVAEAYGGTGTNTGYYGFKNRIINGAMVIDQRNAGAVTTPTTNSYIIDRWAVTMGAASKFTTQLSTTAPNGFTSSLLFTTTTATTGSYFYTYQRIEGFNWADLGWGTANAKTVTLSFWVRSSVTGSHDGFIRDSVAAVDTTYTYSISTANTWEYKSVTIAGATTGTYSTTNGIGASIYINIANEIAVSGATFYITGVQLEKGSTATSFDYRPYGTELSLCQRYFETLTTIYVPTLYKTGATGTVRTSVWFYKVTKRATPTVTTSNISYDNCSGLTIDRNTTDYYSTYATANGGTNFGYNYDFTSSAEL